MIVIAGLACLLGASVAYAARLKGTNGADTIVGTRGDDSIDARGGFDYVLGLGGNDSIWRGRLDPG